MWEVLITLIVVGCTMYFLLVYSRRKDSESELLLDMGVPKSFDMNGKLMDEYADKYFDALEGLEKEYCESKKIKDNEPIPKDWTESMSRVSLYPVKCALMERTLAWVFCYTNLDKEIKRVQPMMQHGLVSQSYWNSIKHCETIIEKEYNLIKTEAIMLDPSTGPRLIQEAVNHFRQFGFPVKEGPGKISADIPLNPAKKEEPEAVPKEMLLTDQEFRVMIEKCTDESTYELMQNPNAAELIVYLPDSTQKQDIKVNGTSDSITLSLNSNAHNTDCTSNPEPYFEKKLKHNIISSELTWIFTNKTSHDVGDKVQLTGLKSIENNGLIGVVQKPNAQSKAANRVVIKLTGDKVLSIRPENLKHPYRKAKSVTITLEKQKKNLIWSMPPWDPEGEKVVRPDMTPAIEKKMKLGKDPRLSAMTL